MGIEPSRSFCGNFFSISSKACVFRETRSSLFVSHDSKRNNGYSESSWKQTNLTFLLFTFFFCVRSTLSWCKLLCQNTQILSSEVHEKVLFFFFLVKKSFNKQLKSATGCLPDLCPSPGLTSLWFQTELDLLSQNHSFQIKCS